MRQLLFPISLFLSASLLFIIQPIVAKVLLPVYGGTPAVWTVCMLFFQLLLLLAYSYAWFLSRLRGRYWRIIHVGVCLVSLAVFPLSFTPKFLADVPELEILVNLIVQLGLPLLVVGASAPLLQFAFSQTQNKQASDPYFLYAASNIGSLLALLMYPWFIERFSGVKQQFYGWNFVYLIYLLCLLCVLFTVRYEPTIAMPARVNALSWRQQARWVFLSFVPCSLMLGVTFYISTDVAATPFFWVLPLALYLLSFILTFANKPLIPHAWVVRNGLFFFIFPILGFIIGANQVQAWQLIFANLLNFFFLALLCHGELVQSRPKADQLTLFYFWLSVGGVLAGVFNGLLAPRLFAHAYEYPLILLLALQCFPEKAFSLSSKSWVIPSIVLGLMSVNYFFPITVGQYNLLAILALALIVIWPGNKRTLFLSMSILFIFIVIPWFKPTEILSQKRNFYGVKQVFSTAGAHVLLSQSTVHGFQVQSDGHQTNGTTSYYGVVLPVVEELQQTHQPLQAIVLGLGTGNLACQFNQQDQLTMVEIDEQVIDIAKNPKLFTYLRDCPPQISLVKNDGLLAVTEVPNASYDLLVMDAFNSDAIPVHLLTLEAFSTYKQKIKKEGVILVNMSNRHLKILPVLTGAGRELDMIVLYKMQTPNQRLGQFAAEWALLTNNEPLAGRLLGKGWHFVTDNKTQVWTNDYSNLMPLLKW